MVDPIDKPGERPIILPDFQDKNPIGGQNDPLEIADTKTADSFGLSRMLNKNFALYGEMGGTVVALPSVLDSSAINGLVADLDVGKIRVVSEHANVEEFLKGENLVYDTEKHGWRKIKFVKVLVTESGEYVRDLKDGETPPPGMKVSEQYEFDDEAGVIRNIDELIRGMLDASFDNSGDTITYKLKGSEKSISLRKDGDEGAGVSVGTVAWNALNTHLGTRRSPKVYNYYDATMSSFYKLNDFVKDDDHWKTISGSAEAGNEVKEIEISLSGHIQGIRRGKDTTDWMVALIAFGSLKKATEVNIERGTVKFQSKTDAQEALRHIFRLDQTDYSDPISHSIAYYSYGQHTGTSFDDAQLQTSWAWGAMNMLTNYQDETVGFSEAGREVFGEIDHSKDKHTAYLPLITTMVNGQPVTKPWTMDSKLYKDRRQNPAPPAGAQYATEEEALKWAETCNKKSYPTPKDVKYLDGRVSIVNDKNMLVINDQGRPVIAVSAHYQTITDDRYYDYSDVDSWTSGNIWLTYDQAYALGELVNLSNQELDLEMSIRRRDEPFRHELPENMEPEFDYWVPFNDPEAEEVADHKNKVALYSFVFDSEIFIERNKLVESLIKNAKAADEETVTLPCGITLTLQQAEELSDALEAGSRGSFEAMNKWWMKNFEGIVGMSLGAVTGAMAFAIAMGLIIPLAIWKVGPFRMIHEAVFRISGKGYAEGTKEAQMDKGNRKKTVEEYAPDLMVTRADIHYHTTLARTSEIKKALFYFASRRRDGKKKQFGTIHAPGGAGKEALYEGMADSLRLGFYPDGSPVEPWVLEQFDEVRLFEYAKAKAGASYENEEEGYVQGVLSYQEEHPSTLVIMDEVNDMASAGASMSDPTPIIQRYYKGVTGQAIAWFLASEDIPDKPPSVAHPRGRQGFLSRLSAGGDVKQWQRRLNPVFKGGWEGQGMGEVSTEGAALIVQVMVKAWAEDNSELYDVDTSKIDLNFIVHLIANANERWPYGEPDRSITDWASFADYMIERAEETEGTFTPTIADLEAWLASDPSGADAKTRAGWKSTEFNPKTYNKRLDEYTKMIQAALARAERLGITDHGIPEFEFERADPKSDYLDGFEAIVAEETADDDSPVEDSSLTPPPVAKPVSGPVDLTETFIGDDGRVKLDRSISAEAGAMAQDLDGLITELLDHYGLEIDDLIKHFDGKNLDGQDVREPTPDQVSRLLRRIVTQHPDESDAHFLQRILVTRNTILNLHYIAQREAKPKAQVKAFAEHFYKMMRHNDAVVLANLDLQGDEKTQKIKNVVKEQAQNYVLQLMANHFVPLESPAAQSGDQGQILRHATREINTIAHAAGLDVGDTHQLMMVAFEQGANESDEDYLNRISLLTMKIEDALKALRVANEGGRDQAHESLAVAIADSLHRGERTKAYFDSNGPVATPADDSTPAGTPGVLPFAPRPDPAATPPDESAILAKVESILDAVGNPGDYDAVFMELVKPAENEDEPHHRTRLIRLAEALDKILNNDLKSDAVRRFLADPATRDAGIQAITALLDQAIAESEALKAPHRAAESSPEPDKPSTDRLETTKTELDTFYQDHPKSSQQTYAVTSREYGRLEGEMRGDSLGLFVLSQTELAYQKIVADTTFEHAGIKEYSLKLRLLQQINDMVIAIEKGDFTDDQVRALAQTMMSERASEFFIVKRGKDKTEASGEVNSQFSRIVRILGEAMVDSAQSQRGKKG